MDTELLKEIGLTDGEIKVYLALFKLGPSSTGPIVKESKVHSSKVYPILDRLIDKGLVSFIKEGKKTIYTSNSPDTILSFLDKKQTKIEEQKKSAKGLVKELELMKTIETAKTEATVFKGVKGLKTAYRTAIKDVKKGDLTYEMFLPPVKDPLINFFINHVKSISKSGIKQRMLFNETCPEATAVEKFARVNVKYISQEFISPAEICVYGNNTIISTTAGKEYITFLVKNKEIADSFKSQFNYIWNQEVNTYFGLEGVKAVFDEILNYKEFYFIGGNWGIIKYYKEFFEDWNKKREEKGVYWYDLVDQEVLVKQRDVPELKHYEIKILPQEVTSPAVILVYGNKVVNILWKKKAILIVIENKEITSHYLKYFDMLWKNSKSN